MDETTARIEILKLALLKLSGNANAESLLVETELIYNKFAQLVGLGADPIKDK